METTFRRLLDLYRRELLEIVIPFWIRYAIDGDGGINTCIEDDGTVINRDRLGWSQWRSLWVFSKLFNCIEPRSEWLDIANGLYRYLTTHGPLPNGHWPLLIDDKGNVQRGYDSLYTDGFAIYGLVEYWRATGDGDAIATAKATFGTALSALESEVPPPTWPYPIPAGCKSHGLSMLFSLSFFELAQATGNDRYHAAALKHHDLVMHHFLRNDSGFVVEWLNRDGTMCNDARGTVVCPGHAIESMWFQIHIARITSSRSVIDEATAVIRHHLEKGWDVQYGGLFLAIDAMDRSEVQWPHANMKLWWPHTESLYATLLSYEYCKQDWCLEWHQAIHDYSFQHFRQPQFGEWTQKLDRHGNVVRETLFHPVKYQFHLPRALFYCIESLNRLVATEAASERNSTIVT